VNEVLITSSPQIELSFLSRNRRVSQWSCEATVAVVNDGRSRSLNNAEGVPVKTLQHFSQ